MWATRSRHPSGRSGLAPAPRTTSARLQAWDLNTGKKVWQVQFQAHLWAPLLVTAGDVLFAGGTQDRQFRAFDARTGDQLWSFPLPSGAIGVPTSFEVDGSSTSPSPQAGPRCARRPERPRRDQ